MKAYLSLVVGVLMCCGVLLNFHATSPAQNQPSGGSIKGKVDFKGKPPKFPPINFNADPACAAMHPGAVVRPEIVTVNPDGTLRDVFVYVNSGLPKQKWPAPATPAKIDQSGCMYIPHVMGVMVNQPIEIINSDGTTHNIHSLPVNNQPFNKAQSQKGVKSTETFTNAEYGATPVRIKCDVHPWMGAWVHVMPHPFFATTGGDGAFEIKGLPDGEYEICAWQEKYGLPCAKVTIKDGNAVEQNFTFERKKEDKGEEKKDEKDDEKKAGG